MTWEDPLVQQLVLHEGKRARAYMDHLGNVTVGVGRNLTGKGLSGDEQLYLLANDIDECVADLATFPWFTRLDPVRQRVVLDMRFNLGPARFRTFKRMRRALEAGEYRLAANAMRNSWWARQVKTRADRLIEMMRSGQEPDLR